jgi:hypothetical protein
VSPAERLVRWYPLAWRERYGDELVALLEDTADEGGGRLRIAVRCRIAIAGLAERGRESGLTGDRAGRTDRARMGALVVAWAGTVFACAGAALAKRSEHLGSATARDVLQAGAAVAALVVVVAAVAASRATVDLLRRDGWSPIARHVRRAVVLTVVGAAATAGLVAWAHSLPPATREHGSGAYGVAFAGWAILLAAALASWTGVAFSLGRRLDLSRRGLASATWSAALLAATMVAMTVTAVVWWTTSPTTGMVQFAPILAVMVAADAAASFGAIRARRTV